jgi:hypothetical protein
MENQDEQHNSPRRKGKGEIGFSMVQERVEGTGEQKWETRKPLVSTVVVFNSKGRLATVQNFKGP